MSAFVAVNAWWFGDWDDTVPLGDGDPQIRRWWSGSEAVDAEVRDHWTRLHGRAVTGELDSWTDDPHGRLALVLLLDQGSRVIHRGEAAAFAQDTRAQQLAREGVDLGEGSALRPIERAFLYMPLMHSEALEDHVRSGELFTELFNETCGLPRAGYYANVLGFGAKHRAIIEQFGRYVHRNALLGRASSPDEEAFLRQPGSSF